jgi:hypothetical protein
MTRRLLPGLAVIAAAMVWTACDAQNPFEIPTTSTPPETFTDTFTGTLTPHGARTHTFSTQASGMVTATLLALSPDAGVTVGLALGTWNGSACQVVIAKDDAAVSSVVTGAVSSLGSLCVRIYDVGALQAPTEYEIQVVHP